MTFNTPASWSCAEQNLSALRISFSVVHEHDGHQLSLKEGQQWKQGKLWRYSSGSAAALHQESKLTMNCVLSWTCEATGQLLWFNDWARKKKKKQSSTHNTWVGHLFLFPIKWQM